MWFLESFESDFESGFEFNFSFECDFDSEKLDSVKFEIKVVWENVFMFFHGQKLWTFGFVFECRIVESLTVYGSVCA